MYYMLECRQDETGEISACGERVEIRVVVNIQGTIIIGVESLEVTGDRNVRC